MRLQILEIKTENLRMLYADSILLPSRPKLRLVVADAEGKGEHKPRDLYVTMHGLIEIDDDLVVIIVKVADGEQMYGGVVDIATDTGLLDPIENVLDFNPHQLLG